MQKILIVDDDRAIQSMMRQILERSGYQTDSASDGHMALDKIRETTPDLVLLDLNMPGPDGFEVAARVKKDPQTRDIPVLLITGLASSQNHIKALDMGMDDFISKTAQPAEIVARVRLHLKVKQMRDQTKNYQRDLEIQVALRTAQLKQAMVQLRDASLDVIFKLTAASEYRDNETGAHVKRMSQYCALIAQKMGLRKKAVEALLHAAPMHDIGKIGIPDSILLKPGQLDARQWRIMKQHTKIGADILKGSNSSFVRMGRIIALTHHEKWDGSGYPSALKGRKIPLAGRIAALADVFDALTSKRPYKEPFSIKQSFQIIMDERGRHFDPDVVNAFFSVREKILKVRNIFQDGGESPLLSVAKMLDKGVAYLPAGPSMQQKRA